MQTLKDLRIAAGKNQAEIASKLKVTQTAICNYETGIRQINLEQILILCELYDVPAEEIIKAQLNSRRITR